MRHVISDMGMEDGGFPLFPWGMEDVMDLECQLPSFKPDARNQQSRAPFTPCEIDVANLTTNALQYIRSIMFFFIMFRSILFYFYWTSFSPFYFTTLHFIFGDLLSHHAMYIKFIFYRYMWESIILNSLILMLWGIIVYDVLQNNLIMLCYIILKFYIIFKYR